MTEEKETIIEYHDRDIDPIGLNYHTRHSTEGLCADHGAWPQESRVRRRVERKHQLVVQLLNRVIRVERL